MSKKTAQIVRAGQLEGVKLFIKKIHNDVLQESISIHNQGTVAQPMSGWVLASLRGQLFYPFPDNLIFLPGLTVVVHSGQQVQGQGWSDRIAQVDLFWTNEQVWNNRGDMATLFDADGFEIDRYIYPHERVMGSSDKRHKMLVQRPDGYQITDAPVHQPGRTIRHTKTSTN
ncbi:MAG: lamin tail domain-containing protein [Anaerolineales bacterium]